MLDSTRKFISNNRRKDIVARKRVLERSIELPHPSKRHILKKSAHYKFLALRKKQHETGMRLQDGTLATIENRWVRKALRADPSLATR